MEKKSVIQRLKEKGLKITGQRLAIIDVLVEHGHLHPGASFIYREARKKQKSLSLVVLTTRGQRVCLQDAGAFGSLGVGFCLLGVGRIAMKLVCHLLQEA